MWDLLDEVGLGDALAHVLPPPEAVNETAFQLLGTLQQAEFTPRRDARDALQIAKGALDAATSFSAQFNKIVDMKAGKLEKQMMMMQIKKRMMTGNYWCSSGIAPAKEHVCCDVACGQCGGGGCSGAPGGAESCCSSRIVENGRFCEDDTDVGCVIPALPAFDPQGMRMSHPLDPTDDLKQLYSWWSEYEYEYVDSDDVYAKRRQWRQHD